MTQSLPMKPYPPAAAGGVAAGALAAALGGGGGSGGLVQTGSGWSFEAATPIGLSVACPQAVSSGSLAKSTRQPSRLKQLWSKVEPMKMQSTGHGSTHSAQNMHFV